MDIKSHLQNWISKQNSYINNLPLEVRYALGIWVIPEGTAIFRQNTNLFDILNYAFINAPPIPKEVTVWKGISGENVFNVVNPRNLIGKEFKYPLFYSTTLIKQESYYFLIMVDREPISREDIIDAIKTGGLRSVLEIKVTPEIKCLFVESGLAEILLPPNCSIVVDRYRVENVDLTEMLIDYNIDTTVPVYFIECHTEICNPPQSYIQPMNDNDFLNSFIPNLQQKLGVSNLPFSQYFDFTIPIELFKGPYQGVSSLCLFSYIIANDELWVLTEISPILYITLPTYNIGEVGFGDYIIRIYTWNFDYKRNILNSQWIKIPIEIIRQTKSLSFKDMLADQSIPLKDKILIQYYPLFTPLLYMLSIIDTLISV